jgi:hypothetical protein
MPVPLVAAPARRLSPIRSSLRFSALEAIAVGGMFAAIEAWVVPLIQVRLHAAEWILGALTLLPQLITIVASTFTKDLILWLGGNRRAALTACWVQVACMALLSIPLWAPVWSGGHAPWAVPMAVALVVVLNGIGVFGGPAWIAWMGGLIPRRVMGRYNGHRTRLFHASRLVFAGCFAGVVWWLPIAESPWGLQLILIAAALSRLTSTLLMTRQVEAPVRPSPPPSDSGRISAQITSLAVFVRRLSSFSFGQFTLVWSLLNLGINVAAPFFAAYLLAKSEHGGLGLADAPCLFSLIIYASTLARLVTYPTAGRLVDAHGPAAVLRLSVVLMLIAPLGWLSGNVWVIVGAELFTGVAWALAECAVGPLLFSCHRDPVERTRFVAWHAIVFNICCVIGVGTGMGLLALNETEWKLPTLGGSHFPVIFLLSIALRIPAVILAWKLLPGLRAVGPTKPEAELWMLIPGAEISMNLGRSVIGLFRRSDD